MKKLKSHPKKSTQPVRSGTGTAVFVSAASILGNTLLFAFKLLAGFLAHSGAMVSDAVHSASDVFSSIVVIVGVKLSARTSDRDHPYGHERFECVAAIVLAVSLLISGLFIGYTAIRKLSAGDPAGLEAPGILALIAAVVSIVVKEGMYWFTRFYAKRLRSGALMADAWHHRSDALSSVGALIGIAGARMGLPVLDTVASLAICVFIIKAAYDIFKDAIDKMVDHACSAQTETEIRQCVTAQAGVRGVDKLRTRVFGNRIYVDLEILADGTLTLLEAHAIAQQVHDAVESRFDSVKHVMVHVNPDTREND